VGDTEPSPLAPAAVLQGARVVLRLVEPSDAAAFARILRTPEVAARWPGDPDELAHELPDVDAVGYAVLFDGAVIGFVQYGENDDPMYRHAGIDLFLDPAVHGRGLGRDTVRAVARHLLTDRGHHRLVIDPSADNHAAIRCYTAVGFKRVGVMRRYERGPDGTFHDGVLLDLLAEDFVAED
jgi:aminoglycoside 6'-N-acetyltransferase